MHARLIVQRFIETQLTRVHATRRPVLAAACYSGFVVQKLKSGRLVTTR